MAENRRRRHTDRACHSRCSSSASLFVLLAAAPHSAPVRNNLRPRKSRTKMSHAQRARCGSLPPQSLVLGGAVDRTPRAAVRAQGTPAAAPISFNREILPILANNCFACHGPDEKKRETKFHFDTQDGMFLEARSHRPGQCGGEPAGREDHRPESEGAHAAARLRAHA